MAANPEYNPSGVGDCIDTNKLPWIPIPNAPGMSIKPARASGESGIFSLIFNIYSDLTSTNQRTIELTNLITLWKVRIKVIFSIKL